MATSTIPFSAPICALQLLKVNGIYRSSVGGIQHNSMTVSETETGHWVILYISCLLNTTIYVRTRVNHAHKHYGDIVTGANHIAVNYSHKTHTFMSTGVTD